MQVEQTDQGFALYKEKERIGWVPARAQPGGGAYYLIIHIVMM